MMDRLSAMRALVRVIETGSFSAAARQLQVGQPAVSRSIAQLEKRLGVRLLLRSSRRLMPTEAGRNFYEHAKRSLDEADEAEHAARGAAATLTGTLRFAGAVTFARLHVIPRLPVFLAEHPALKIEVVLDDRQVDLIEEGIDVALRMGTLGDSNYVAHRIGRCRRIVGASRAYLERHGRPSQPEDLIAHKAVIYTQGGGGRTWTFRRGNVEQAVTLGDDLRTTAAEAMREAVFAGLGLCVTSEWMLSHLPPGIEVEELLSDWKLPDLDLWAVFPAGRKASSKARAFAAFIEKHMQLDGFGIDPASA